MTDTAKSTAPTYELTVAGGASLLLSPLSEADAQRLGAAFAAIDPWAAYGYAAETLVKFLATVEPGAQRLALTYEGSVVGAVVIRPAWLRGPYLQFLAILPGAQGQKLGSAFLAWMEREARDAGERNLWVAASEINGDAIRFYLRHGFQPAAHLDDLAYDGRTEILFRKRLV